MYLITALVLVAFPFLAEASSLRDTSKTGLSIPLSKRSTLHSTDGTVDITKVHASRHHTISKIKRGFHTFKKKTGKPHPLASKPGHSSSMHRRKFGHSHKSRIVGSETLDYQPGLWYGPITVGTPEQTFTVSIDTGSSDLFLPDIDCDAACKGHKLYDPSQSSTSQLVGSPINLGYGDSSQNSSASVHIYKDTVTLAGYTATGQMLGAATNMSGFDISYFAADGLLGLAYQSISAYQASPVFQSLVTQGQVPEPVFGLYMTQSNNSELFVGGLNKKHYAGSITYVPVEHQAYWQTSFDNVTVNGKSVLGNSSVIIDSGTSIIFGHTAAVRAIYENIPGSEEIGGGSWAYPCDTNVTVSIIFGGTPFTISPKTLSLGPYGSGSNKCVGSISADDNFDFWIIGDPFLQCVYTVFDLGNNQVGFASLPSFG